MLTSVPFVVVVCLVALGLVFSLPFLIARSRRRLSAILKVVAVSLVQVVAVGLVINLPMQYVSTPTELWQMLSNQQNTKVKITDTQRARVLKKRASVASEKINPLTDPALPGQEEWIPQFKPRGKAGAITVFSGPKSGVKEKVMVWTPEGYDPADRSQTYNVIEFLHGYPGSPVSVALALDFSGSLQKAIDKGEIAPTIAVIPEGNVDLKAPTCADVSGKAQTATWLSFDIPKMVRSTFPNVSDKRKDWLITGNSSGAYCAGRLGIAYGDVFGASAILSGYDQPLVGSWGGHTSAAFADNTLSNLVGEPRPWPLNMYVFGAQMDRDSLHLAKNLARAPFKAGDRLQLNIKAEGGHNWATWREQMPELYRWWQQVRTSEAPTDSQIKGADSALLPETTPGLFSLMGWGTILVSALVAILALAALIRRVPKVMKTATRAAYVRALAGSVGAMILVIVAVLLPVNRWGEFYTSVMELVHTITGGA